MARGIAKKHWRTWSGSLCSRKWYSVNFCGRFFYSMFREYDSLYVGVIIFAISISIYMVFYSRHSIASLRALRRQEASEGCRYTFMDIEGIREKRAARATQATAHMDSTLYSQRGIGKLLVGGKASAALAFIPQLIIDDHDATSVEDLLKRSAYSQPANGLACASGVIVGAELGSVTAVVAIPVGLAVALMVQIFMSDDVSGFDNDLGNFLTGKE